jgi:hypothetical protein
VATHTFVDSFRTARHRSKELASWAARQYAAPAPAFVKREAVLRNGIATATWVETGTFQGDTTAFLAQRAKRVVSIEPEPTLHAAAAARFQGVANVEIRKGLSEDVLPEVLPTLSGDVCFWLDGHFSAGFTHKGPKDTPIADELLHIEKALPRWERVAVLVDDVRCFDPQDPIHTEYQGYPERRFLVEWAERNKLVWHIELDIFVARNFR